MASRVGKKVVVRRSVVRVAAVAGVIDRRNSKATADRWGLVPKVKVPAKAVAVDLIAVVRDVPPVASAEVPVALVAGSGVVAVNVAPCRPVRMVSKKDPPRCLRRRHDQ